MWMGNWLTSLHASLASHYTRRFPRRPRRRSWIPGRPAFVNIEKLEDRTLLTPWFTDVFVPAGVNETETIIVSGVVHDDGTDPVNVTIDFGDGYFDTIWGITPGSSFSSSHEYWDDDPTDTSSDDYTVTLSAEDFEFNFTSESHIVTVSNLPPALTVNTPPPATALVNETVTIDGTVTDPSMNDFLSASVDWGDGNSDSYPGGMFTFSHQYSTAGTYTISVVGEDDDLGTSDPETFTLTVAADTTPPQFTGLTGPSPSTISEGESTFLYGTVTDDSGGMVTLRVYWYDGAAPYEMTVFSGYDFDFWHTYEDDNPSGTPSDDYTITLEAIDADLNVNTVTFTVTVDNVAPVIFVDTPPPSSVMLGQSVTVGGSVIDPGTPDDLSVILDWGDGSPIEFVGTIFWSEHEYLTTGDYTITIAADDDDLGTTVVSYPISVVPSTPPNAVDDTAYSGKDSPVTIFVLMNDSDAELDPLTITAVTAPANGTVTFTDDSVTYTPNPGFASGTDTFEYTVGDGNGSFSSGTVTVIIVEVTDFVLEWAQPDGSWLVVPDGDLVWSHDELRWTAIFGPKDPPFATSIEWLAKPWNEVSDPTSPWQAFASAGCDCPAVGNPGADDWAVTPQVHFDGFIAQTGFAVAMQVPKRPIIGEIESIEWKTHLNNDGTPSATAGELEALERGSRFFPDASAPGGVPRFQVDVLVKLKPRLAGISIGMIPYDVDDTTDFDGPIDDDPDREVTSINNSDNRPTLGALAHYNLTWEVSNANGEIRAVFGIGWIQPGNNFRIAAAPRAAELARVKPLALDPFSGLWYDTNNDGFWTADEPFIRDPVPERGIRATPVLTVWRKLHIEVDSMGAVSGNSLSNTVASVVDNGDGTSTITLGTLLSASDENRFQNGKLLDLVANEFPIISNTTTTVRVSNLFGGTIPAGGGGPVTLLDDDWLQNGEDVPMPDVEGVAAAFRDAFIEVAFDVGDSNDNVPFAANVERNAPAIDAVKDWDSVGQNSRFYWVTYLLAAFQGPVGEDADPDDENAGNPLLGVASSTGGALIFLEAIADYTRRTGIDPVSLEREAVIHELGHAVAASGVDPVTEWQVSGEFGSFTEEYINAIRATSKPADPANPIPPPPPPP